MLQTLYLVYMTMGRKPRERVMGAGGGADSDEDGIRGIQLEGSYKHSVVVCDYGDDGSSDDNGAGNRGSGWVSTRRML